LACSRRWSRRGKTLGTHGPGMFANQLDKLVNAEQQSRTKRALYETAQFRSMHIAAKRVAADPRANAKVNAMLDVVSAHFAAFAAAQSSTRVIVFTQWRDSVYEVVRQLGERGGAIKPVAFVGQSDAKQGLTTVKGLNQREQSRIVRQFRDGELNVLVSTCIGEEGLDIGEVDLIVCFDVSSDSRALVQRMGRTGRKRNGRCVILCTDAERILYERNVHANHQIAETIVRRQSEAFKRYEHNERMLPAPPSVVERRFEPMPPIAAARRPAPSGTRAARTRAQDRRRR
jgi:Fanconi anemia group M protein